VAAHGADELPGTLIQLDLSRAALPVRGRPGAGVDVGVEPGVELPIQHQVPAIGIFNLGDRGLVLILGDVGDGLLSASTLRILILWDNEDNTDRPLSSSTQRMGPSPMG
jgi:hypothetical protein